MGVSPPKQVVGRKTGTVPDCGRVLAAGGCPEFCADRKACPELDRRVFLSPDYKEEQLRDTVYGRQLTAFRLRPSDSDSGRSAVSRKPMACSAHGWDVSNKAGLTEVFKPVIHEEPIKTAGADSRVRSEASRRPTKLLTCASVEAY